MVYISGANKGAIGFGMSGALYPTNMGGPFGNKNMQLPNKYQFPAKMFGKSKKTRNTRKSKKSKKSKKTRNTRNARNNFKK
jgi:hypothetical protein